MWWDCKFPVYSLLPGISWPRCHLITRHFYPPPESSDEEWGTSGTLSLSFCFSLETPQRWPPPVDRLTKAQRDSIIILKALFLTYFRTEFFFSPFWVLVLVLYALTSWNDSYKTLFSWKSYWKVFSFFLISLPFFLSLSFLLSSCISSALWQCLTPGSRPYPSCSE